MLQTAHAPPELTLSDRELQVVRSGGTVQLGAHTLTIDGELACLSIGGHMPLSEVIHTHLFFEEMMRLGRRVFLLAIGHSKPQLMPPDVRRWLAQWNRKYRPSGVAMVTNLSWAPTMLMTLLLRAINTLRGTPLPSGFFSSEAEARAWLKSIMQPPAK